VRAQVDYPRSWYAASCAIPPARPKIAGAHTCDVCLIGGGLAGLTTALELALSGKDVILLEANRIGWGASGRNGGFVSPGFAESLTQIVRRVGLGEAQALFRLSVEGAEYVRARIAELDPAIRTGDGWIVVTRYPDPVRQRQLVEMLARDFGQQVELLDAEQTRKLLKSKRYYESRLDPKAFHIHPLRYCFALARAAQSQGARLYEGSRVVSVERSGSAHLVATPEAKVTAGQVVFCHNHPGLSRIMARAMLPVATYIAVTEPLGERASEAVSTTAAVADTRRAGNYYRLIDDDRLLWGGKITTRLAEPSRLAEMMKQDMLRIYPQLGDPKMEFAWNGLMGYALHKMPLIGETEQGVWMASGFGGHGLNTTAMAGLLIARAITGGDDEWRRFSAFGAPWVGGWLGRAGVQISYWNMQLKDRLDERRAVPTP
jgi:gamma-glutamylputrescine oxidase